MTNSLKAFQQQLGLKNEDIILIEQPIREPIETKYREKLKQQEQAEQQRQRELEERRKAEQEKLRQEAERQRQEQEKAEYENKLRRYEQEFTKAVQAEYPLNQFVIEGLKTLQQQLGLKRQDVTKIEQPLITLKQAVRESAVARYNYGLEFSDQGELEEAIKEYHKAISIDPNFTDAYVVLGMTLFSRGKAEEAIQQCRKAISIDPNFAHAYAVLGVILSDQGKSEEAIQQCRKAISIDPNNPDHAGVYYSLGWDLYKQGKWVESIAAFKDAVNLEPDNTDYRASLEQLSVDDLESALKSGDWSLANELTWAKLHLLSDYESNSVLGIMLPESLEKIPCDYIILIDQLWQKYSGNRFGFTSQRNMFLRVSRDINQFVESVGWRGKAGLFGGAFAWKTFHNLNFSLNAPEGCFPIDMNFFLREDELIHQEPFWMKTGGYDPNTVVSTFINALIKRLDECKI